MVYCKIFIREGMVIIELPTVELELSPSDALMMASAIAMAAGICEENVCAILSAPAAVN